MGYLQERISRRETLGLLGGFALSLALGCENGSETSFYAKYKEHVETQGIGLPSGTLRYINVGNEDFTELENSIKSPILLVDKIPSVINQTLEPGDPPHLFKQTLKNTSSIFQMSHQFQNTEFSFYYSNETSLSLDTGAIDPFITWIKKSKNFGPSLYSGRVEQHIVMASFSRIPGFIEVVKSASSFFSESSGYRIMYTFMPLNLPEEYGKHDSVLVTEIAQGLLTSSGIERERQANSISLVYQYALRGKPDSPLT